MTLLLLLFAVLSDCSLQFVQWQALMDIYNQTSEISVTAASSRFRFRFSFTEKKCQLKTVPPNCLLLVSVVSMIVLFRMSHTLPGPALMCLGWGASVVGLCVSVCCDSVLLTSFRFSLCRNFRGSLAGSLPSSIGLLTDLHYLAFTQCRPGWHHSVRALESALSERILNSLIHGCTGTLSSRIGELTQLRTFRLQSQYLG
jgi:hypothetical protein